MRCSLLDYGVTECRVYNQGVEIPSITDYTAGPWTIIPFKNYIIYAPIKCYYRNESGLIVLYDETDTKRMVISAGISVMLENASTIMEAGTPFMLCGLSGNTKRSKVQALGSFYSYYGNGFTFALYGIDEATIFPDGVEGGLQNIQGTALPETSQVLVYYHRLTDITTTERSPKAFTRERGTEALPNGYNGSYVGFKQWSSSQLKDVAVTDTDDSFQFIFGSYTPKEVVGYTVELANIAIHYSQYGNPVIPKDAPTTIPMMVRISNSSKIITPLYSFAPIFSDFNLTWYTSQNLYVTGWRAIQSTKGAAGWSTGTAYDSDFTFNRFTFSNVSNLENTALFVAPETAYIEREEVADIAHILFLDKAAGVDEVKDYAIKEGVTGGLYVTIDTNPVQYVKVWRGVTCCIARYMKEVDEEDEHYPPGDFSDLDERGGLQWGAFGILEWTPNDANYDTSGEPDIIPILFLLSRQGKFPLNF